MDKKKALKIATATSVAAGAFVSAAPASFAASSQYKKADAAVKTAEKEAAKLKEKYYPKSKKFSFTKISTTATESAYSKAYKEVKKLSSKDEKKFEKRLAGIKSNITYAKGYNTAIDKGSALDKATKAANDLVKKYDAKKADATLKSLKSAIDAFKGAVAKGKVYGIPTRDAFNKKYLTPADSAYKALDKKMKDEKAKAEYAKKLADATNKVVALEKADISTLEKANKALGLVKPAKDAIKLLNEKDQAKLNYRVDVAVLKINDAINKLTPLVVKSVSAIDPTTLKVTFANDEVAEIKLDNALKANVSTEVTFKYKGLEYKATVTFKVDAPEVTVSGITDDELTKESNKTLSVKATNGADVKVSLNGKDVSVNEDGKYTVGLVEGENTIEVVASVYGVETKVVKKVTLDTKAPEIKISELPETVNKDLIKLSVNTEDNATVSVTVGGVKLAASEDGSYPVPLAEGDNEIVVTATDKAGNSGEIKKVVKYVNLETVAKKAVEALEKSITDLSTQEKIDAANELVGPAEEAIKALPEGNENIVTLTTRVNNAKEAIAKAQPIVKATEAVVKAEDSLIEADLSAAQKQVTDLQGSDEKTLLQARIDTVKAKITAIIKNVNDAKNDIQLWNALNVKPFTNVIQDNITEYNTALDGTQKTIADIQNVINTVNDKVAKDAAYQLFANAENAVKLAEKDFTVENEADLIAAAQSAIDKLPADSTEEGAKTPKADLQKRLDSVKTKSQNWLTVVKPVINANQLGQFPLYNALKDNFKNVDFNLIKEYGDAIEGTETTVEEIQYRIDVVNATVAVEALTKDGILAEGVGQAEIDAASKLVEALPADVDQSTTKANLQKSVKDAQTLLDLANQVKEATAKVNSLFADDKQNALADGVDQGKIDAASKLVQALEGKADTTNLQSLVGKAQDLLDIKTATTAVNALFTDKNQDKLASGVDQAKIDTASELVAKVKDESQKNNLGVSVKKAQDLLDNANFEAAKAAVNALFTDEKQEKLASDVDQAKIDTASELVAKVKDENQKNNLEASVKKAQDLLDNGNFEAAKAAVNALFANEKQETLADGVDQAKIDTASALVAKVKGEEQQGTLRELVANAQDLLDLSYVNKAASVTEMRSAITTVAIKRNVSAYLDLSSTAKLEVAELVLNAKPANGYATTNNVVTGVQDQITKRTTLIQNVNSATTITAMDTALQELEYNAYDSLSKAQKIDVAEKVLVGKPANGYDTLAAIKSAIDAATK